MKTILPEVIAGVLVVAVVGVFTWAWQQLPRPVLRIRVEPAHKAAHTWHQALNRDLDDADWSAARKGFERQLGAVVLYEELRRRGSVDADRTEYQLSIRNNSRDEVRLRNLVAIRLRGHPPIRRAFVQSPTAGSRTATLLLFDLDEPEADAWEGKLEYGISRLGGAPYFDRGGEFVLARGETEPLLIHAEISNGFVEWVLRLSWEHKGIARSTLIYDADGSPFRTTASVAGYDAYWGTGVMASPDNPLRSYNPATGV